jgi:ABC-2 type transport system permease protein
MRNIWTIAKKEIRYYFSTPAAYLVGFLVLLIVGIIFYLQMNIARLGQGQYVPGPQDSIGVLAWLLVFLATPAITFRTITTENSQGTIELMLTAPVRDWEFIVGKWLGAFLTLSTVVMITLIYPIILNSLVDPGIDQGVLISGFIGVLLFLASLVGIGVAISSFFNHQIATFLVTEAIFVVVFFVAGSISQLLTPQGFASELLGFFNLRDPLYSNMMRGVLDLKDIIQYLSMTALTLFLGSVSVETRRWR